MRVLFVCTGNICRSPMAEHLLRHRAEEVGWQDLVVGSAGTWADDGAPATLEAQQVLAAEGIDGSHHSSRSLTEELVDEADIVVAMTSVHLREIASMAPGHDTKTFLMKEISEMGGDGSKGLDRLLSATRPEWRRALDLDDPMGLPLLTYQRCFGEISSAVDLLVGRLGPSA